MSSNEANKKSTSKKSIVLGLVAVGAVALAFGLGFGLSNRDNDPKAVNSGSSNANNNVTLPGNSSVDDEPTVKSFRLPIASRRSLARIYGSCDELRPDLEIMATILLNQTIMQYTEDWQYHKGPRPEIMATVDTAVNDASSGRAPAPASSPVSTDESSFGTNNQVEGVDEPDMVKSDGKHVWVVYGTEIVKMDADEVSVIDRTEIPQSKNAVDEQEGDERRGFVGGCANSKDRVAGMLLIDDRLVVATAPTSCYWFRRQRELLSLFPGGGGVDNSKIVSDEETTIIVYDKNSMQVLAQDKIKGSYTSARAIGNNVHVITSTNLNYYWPFLRYFEPWQVAPNATTAEEYEATARAAAESRIDAFVTQMASEVDCESIQQLTMMQNTDTITRHGSYFQSMSNIHSFDATDFPASLATTTMVQPGSTWQVYSSKTQLVLSTAGYWFDVDSIEETYLLTYELDGPKAVFQAMGKVPGTVLNQFSISHQEKGGDDYLRVATTTNARWTWDRETGESTMISDSTSQVTILQVTDDDLEQVGEITGLGKTRETIQSVRFMGDKGYVVTFRRTDPFYTLDLSDPTKPFAAGELEIPGMSSYLHPVTEDLLLGVGQDADDEGVTIGTQIALFDVSDFANPDRIQNYTIPNGNSEAEWDHKAFRYLPISKLLIIPLSIHDWRNMRGTGFDGFRVFSVDKDAGIAPYYSIEHANDFGGCWSSAFLNPRSLVFGGDVMTMKGHSILSHDLSERVEEAKPINLDEGATKDCHYYWRGAGPILE